MNTAETIPALQITRRYIPTKDGADRVEMKIGAEWKLLGFRKNGLFAAKLNTLRVMLLRASAV